MIRIAVLEDNPKDYKTLSGHIQQFSQETGTELGITHFENGITFLESGSTQFDIVFMDIEMPLMNGMEAARKMRAENRRSILIFTTNVAQYAIQGYEVDAMDYLLKPVGYFNLSLKLRKALSRLESSQMTEEQITLTLSDGMRIVPIHTICYVEVNQHMLTYHADADWSVRGTMKKAETELLVHHFAKCSSSYLVNLRKVAGIDEDDVLVRTRNGIERLAMSRRMKKDFAVALMKVLTKGAGA